MQLDPSLIVPIASVLVTEAKVEGASVTGLARILEHIDLPPGYIATLKRVVTKTEGSV